MNARFQIAFVCALLTHAGLGIWIEQGLRLTLRGEYSAAPPSIEVGLVAGISEETQEPESAARGNPGPPVDSKPETEPVPQPEMEPPPQAEPEPPAEPVPAPTPDPEPVPKPEPQPDPIPPTVPEKAEPKEPTPPPPKPEPKPEPSAKSRQPAKPQPARSAKPPPSRSSGSPSGSAASGSSSGSSGTARAKSRGANSGPVLISSYDPPYPPGLLQKRMGGSVVLELGIDASGRVTSASVARSSGYPEMDLAARETVRNWRFRPAQRDGVPISFRATQRVVFRP